MKALVLVPTYNERDNLPVLVREILAVPDATVMVLDDQSPDGTGEVADRLAAESGGRVRVLHRTGPRGLGVSYLEGFRRALDTDCDVVCQMDADLSHDPKFLPEMLARIEAGADLVIGSRYLNGVSVVNWPLRRIILSAFANWYIRTVTGLGVRDCTTGYRCWRRTALATLPLDKVVSEGYAFIVDITFMAAARGLRIVESPIIFIERRQGASKLSTRVLMESLMTPWKLVARHGRLRSRER
jgi:dolichol-phosphate mannosyltransferase